jgi:UPF0716 family protein affecting phage T7 exclusion
MSAPAPGPGEELSRRLAQARTLWVIAVLGFWVTLGIIGVVIYVKGTLDLILVSVALGMMVLGVWLKARYQWLQRRARQAEPPPE